MSAGDKKMVYKANALVEASYRLSPMEQRILLSCVAQVQRSGASEITDGVMYSVTYADIEALTGHVTKTIREDLRQATLRLKRREVWIRERPNGEGRLDTDLVTGWVQSVRLVPGGNRVELRFSKDIIPYVAQLQQQFTRFELLDVAHMTSAHAMRIYELLVQWRTARSRTVPIPWLRRILQLEDRYAAIKDLKRRVILPAVEQINAHSPLTVRWEQRKSGRRVTHIIFIFEEKEKKMERCLGKLHHPSPPPAPAQQSTAEPTDDWVPPRLRGERRYGYVDKKTIERLAKPGETYEEAAMRIRNQSRD